MVKIYANLIRQGLKSIADVPSLIRAAVEKELEERAGEDGK